MDPNQPFITVSSNYRLGPAGWISSPGEDMTPNAGIWDGIAALEWTKQYISHFGGDPDQITAIGESAGGGIIEHMLTMHGGQGRPPPFTQVSTIVVHCTLLNILGNHDIPWLRTPHQRFSSND
jgi:acetyl esterase/lipase